VLQLQRFDFDERNAYSRVAKPSWWNCRA